MHHSLTVIVPVRNQLEHLKVCCDIVLANFRNDYPDGQLIVVDMNSNDGTEAWLSGQSDISYIAIEDEVCKSQAYNTALEYANGEMVLFINCDAYITDHTISRLERYLYSKDDIAAVGPVFSKIEIDNLQKYSGIMPDFKNIYDAREFSNYLFRREFTRRIYDTNFLYDFCLLAKKEAVISVGGFDVDYYANSMEDIDLSLRLIKSGYKLNVVPAVFVYNDRQWAFLDRGYDLYEAYCKMTQIFENKWNFNFFYSGNLRNDLLKYIDCSKKI